MQEAVNVTTISIEEDEAGDSRRSMIEVDGVSMVFNMASERLNNLKEYAIALARRELRFKEFWALRDISLDVKEGDVFGILGTNGSGKSTLLKIIAGVLEPTKGECRIHGNIAPLIELGAGFDMELTARENIYLNGALLGYPKKFIQRHFDEIVEFAEIEQFLDMPLKNYSSGMVARIAFAIATVIVPEILIVDEVLSVGDFMFQKKCEDRIMSLIKEHNVTVLIVSHNHDQVERLCNKAAWIEKGHMRMLGSAKDVCDTYRVLGGHSGGSESEEKVLSILQSKVGPRKGSCGALSADSRYGMAAKASGLSFPDGAACTVITPGDRNMENLLATGLAGALGAPILLTQEGHVPDATLQELGRLCASEAILVGCDEDVARDLETQFGKRMRFTCLNAPSYPELSRAVYQHGRERGFWGETVIVTYVECVTDLVTLSPYTYARKCPVLLQERHLDHVDDGSMRIASEGGFSEVLVLGSDHGFPEEALELLREMGKDVVRFCGRDVFDANRTINEWLIGQPSSDFEETELLISSAWNAPDAFGIAPYAAKDGCLIMLEDPNDLDSVASCIDYIMGKEGRVRKVTFVGDHNRFTEMDRKLLAKAVSCSKTVS